MLGGLFPLAATPPFRIALYNGGGAFGGGMGHELEFYQAVNTAATSLSRAHNTSFNLHNITEKNTTSLLNHSYFDVVIFPGGSGSAQAKALGNEGLDTVQAFVSRGGGYIGTCGGAFLAIQHLYLYGKPAPPAVEPWMRGHGPVLVEFTDMGVDQLQLGSAYRDANVSIEYWQGPIVKAADFPPSVALLSFFRSEIHTLSPNKTTGNMVNTPAMTSASYGKGRVVLNSPHPEIPPEHIGGRTSPEIYQGELEWVLGLSR
jgi:glutamine amidotransferase-like uncharacterized protein